MKEAIVASGQRGV